VRSKEESVDEVSRLDLVAADARVGATFIALIILGAIIGEDENKGGTPKEKAAAQPQCVTALEITEPRNGATTDSKRMRIKGRSDPEADVTVTVYSADHTPSVRADGQSHRR
jgi:hypothetical protein